MLFRKNLESLWTAAVFVSLLYVMTASKNPARIVALENQPDVSEMQVAADLR